MLKNMNQGSAFKCFVALTWGWMPVNFGDLARAISSTK
jgi:hypothetical protein